MARRRQTYLRLTITSGLVTRPAAVELDKAGVHLTVACRTQQSAKQLSEGLKHANPTTIDVDDAAALEAEIAKNDLVISLIPYEILG